MTTTLNARPSRPDGSAALDVRAALRVGGISLTRRRAGAIAAAVAILVAVALSGRGSGRDLILPVGIALMVGLAYANGSNDVSKAIATLAGSGVTNYRRAIAWGTVCTVIGSLCSAFIAKTLIGTFTKGFIAKSASQTEIFALAVLIGAVLWVLLATRISMPVSTTHAIIGSLVTVGAFVFGAHNVQWRSLLSKVVIPLVASPFIALALALAAYLIIKVTLTRLSGRVMNSLHWLSSGVASFARGLNDTPKIVALGVAFYLISSGNPKYQTPFWLFALVALGMGLGSFISGFKVTKTLAEKVTKMDNAEGFSANIVTAFLVAYASNLGLPVSTTHVSSGAIIGIGLRRGVNSVRWKVVRDMALAWVVTLPAAGLLGVLAYVALRAVHGGM